jgi:hypothetical protein
LPILARPNCCKSVISVVDVAVALCSPFQHDRRVDWYPSGNKVYSPAVHRDIPETMALGQWTFQASTICACLCYNTALGHQQWVYLSIKWLI